MRNDNFSSYVNSDDFAMGFKGIYKKAPAQLSLVIIFHSPKPSYSVLPSFSVRSFNSTT